MKASTTLPRESAGRTLELAVRQDRKKRKERQPVSAWVPKQVSDQDEKALHCTPTCTDRGLTRRSLSSEDAECNLFLSTYLAICFADKFDPSVLLTTLVSITSRTRSQPTGNLRYLLRRTGQAFAAISQPDDHYLHKRALDFALPLAGSLRLESDVLDVGHNPFPIAAYVTV